METEYVSRQEVYNALLDELCGTGYQSDALLALDMCKSKDVEPVEYAHWIEINYGTIAECSKCFDMFDVIDTDSIKIANKAFDNFCALYNYCPNCGRKMVKEDKDD